MERLHFLDFGVGSHHELLAPERDREHSIGDQMQAWNVGIMERLPQTYPKVFSQREKSLALDLRYSFWP